jgi:hypothetical protein
MVPKSGNRFSDKILVLWPDALSGDADLDRDGAIVQTIGRQKDNLGAQRIRPRDLATSHPRF